MTFAWASPQLVGEFESPGYTNGRATRYTIVDSPAATTSSGHEGSVVLGTESEIAPEEKTWVGDLMGLRGNPKPAS